MAEPDRVHRTRATPAVGALLATLMSSAVGACWAPTDDAPDQEGAPPWNAPSMGWIVFTSSRSGEGDVFGIESIGAQPLLVAGGAAPEGTVRFDPARNRLVYHRYVNEVTEIMTGDVVLMTDSTGRIEPQWSASGDIVYALESEAGGSLVVADSAGRQTRRLLEDQAVERYPAWSPSGDRLAYAKRLPTGWDLHVVDVAEESERRLTFDGVYVGHPSWSPDGSRLAFDGMIDGQTEIWIIDVESLATTRLTERAGMELAPAWSLDGRFIAYGSDNESGWDIWLADLGTSEAIRLTVDSANDVGPIFVPEDALPTR